MASDLPQAPRGLESPIAIDHSSSRFDVWSGDANLRFESRSDTGLAEIYLDLLPSPAFRFELAPDTALTLRDAFTNPPLGEAILETGTAFGDLEVTANKSNSSRSGYLEPQSLHASDISKATYLLVNGPKTEAIPISRGRGGFAGRVLAEIANATITVDQLRSSLHDGNASYDVTHVACVEHHSPVSAAQANAVTDSLFRALSLMKCRWVGVVGPWTTYAQSLECVSLNVTKTTPRGGTLSWYHERIPNCFEQLLSALHLSYQHKDRANALQTAFHWLVESEQCAGGVEGSIILQQAALECLAWLEIVQLRALCSSGGFKNLPAADKIRWLLSLNKIPANIPAHCDEIQAYASAFTLGDLVDVIVDVRNGLIHAEPNRAPRLFGRITGDEERSGIWFQAGGLLHQAFLAAIGYNGEIVRRDIDTTSFSAAMQKVPWAE